MSLTDLLATIRGLEYEPEVVQRTATPTGAPDPIDPASLPTDLRALLVLARSSGKAVLVEFSGPG